METYVVKIFDSRINRERVLSLNGVDEVIGALQICSCHSDLNLRSVILDVSE